MDSMLQDSFGGEIKSAFEEEIRESSELQPPQFLKTQRWTRQDFIIGIGNLAAGLLIALFAFSNSNPSPLATEFTNKIEKVQIKEALDTVFEGIVTLRHSLNITIETGERDEN